MFNRAFTLSFGGVLLIAGRAEISAFFPETDTLRLSLVEETDYFFQQVLNHPLNTHPAWPMAFVYSGFGEGRGNFLEYNQEDPTQNWLRFPYLFRGYRNPDTPFSVEQLGVLDLLPAFRPAHLLKQAAQNLNYSLATSGPDALFPSDWLLPYTGGAPLPMNWALLGYFQAAVNNVGISFSQVLGLASFIFPPDAVPVPVYKIPISGEMEVNTSFRFLNTYPDDLTVFIEFSQRFPQEDSPELFLGQWLIDCPPSVETVFEAPLKLKVQAGKELLVRTYFSIPIDYSADSYLLELNGSFPDAAFALEPKNLLPSANMGQLLNNYLQAQGKILVCNPISKAVGLKENPFLGLLSTARISPTETISLQKEIEEFKVKEIAHDFELDLKEVFEEQLLRWGEALPNIALQLDNGISSKTISVTDLTAPASEEELLAFGIRSLSSRFSPLIREVGFVPLGEDDDWLHPHQGGFTYPVLLTESVQWPLEAQSLWKKLSTIAPLRASRLQAILKIRPNTLNAILGGNVLLRFGGNLYYVLRLGTIKHRSQNSEVLSSEQGLIELEAELLGIF